MQQILDYLQENVNEIYAEKYLNRVVDTLNAVADHPTNGMIVDSARKIRRWRLERHNYALYLVRDGYILLVNILPYRLNKKGF